jgi:hypothetical protein
VKTQRATIFHGQCSEGQKRPTPVAMIRFSRSWLNASYSDCPTAAPSLPSARTRHRHNHK